MARSRAVVVVIVIAAASFSGWWFGRHGPGVAPNSTTAPAGTRVDALVTETVDGDTVHVQTSSGPDTVRLLGINTPETHHPRKPVECYGPEASAYTEQVLTGRRVRLELDVEQRDKYGRLLAYIVVDGRRFNDELLRRGYARVLIISPNGAYARPMIEEELAAKRARRGLWGAC
jgi:micrococcal nuclease